MRITLFTSNNSRHNYLVNLLSKFAKKLFVVQESKTIFQGITPGNYPVSKISRKYFKNVNLAQRKIFGDAFIDNSKKNISILPLVFGDLNKCNLKLLSKFLKSDLYIVFGSSYIKGDLVNFLVKKKAINIHMGVSPYYRGTDCNFWALYDDNPHLAGSTIHLLSKGLDSGPILFHALSKIGKKNPYEYTMSTVKSAFIAITKRIKDKSILKIKPIKQDKRKEVRYSKKKDFNDNILKKYFSKKIKVNLKKFNHSLYKNPYFLE